MAKAKTHPESKFGSILSNYERLNNLNDLSTYKEMSQDSIINAVLDSIRIPIHEATYDVTPASTDRKDTKISSVVFSSLLQAIDFKQLIKTATNMLIFGFQTFEIVMERRKIDRNWYVLPKIVSPIPSNTLVEEVGSRNEFGQLIYLTQEVDGKSIKINREKLLIITANAQSVEDWRGESPLNSVHEEWWMKNKFWILQAKTLEKYGPGIDVIELPPQEDNYQGYQDSDQNVGLSSETLQKLKDETSKELDKISEGTATNIVIPNGGNYRIAERSGPYPDLLNTIKRLEDNIATAFLASHLKLGGTGTSSSNALGVTLSDLFLQSVKGRAQVIVDAINRDLVRKIVDMNFGEQKRYPELVVSNINKTTSKDLFMFMQYTPILSQMPEVIQFILDEIGISADPKKIESLINENENRENNNEQQSEDQDVEEN